MPIGFQKPSETAQNEDVKKYITDKYIKKLYAPENAMSPIQEYLTNGFVSSQWNKKLPTTPIKKEVKEEPQKIPQQPIYNIQSTAYSIEKPNEVKLAKKPPEQKVPMVDYLNFSPTSAQGIVQSPLKPTEAVITTSKSSNEPLTTQSPQVKIPNPINNQSSASNFTNMVNFPTASSIGTNQPAQNSVPSQIGLDRKSVV